MEEEHQAHIDMDRRITNEATDQLGATEATIQI